MPKPTRLTALALAALMLPASLTTAVAQPFPPAPPPERDGGTKPAWSAPPAFTPRQATQPAFEAGVPEEELRTAADDPPVLVGRIARSTGAASIRLPGAEDWQPATLNTAIIPGTAFWTEPGGRLALEVAQNRLFLDGNTAVQVDELDDDGMRATLAQGSGFLRVQGAEADSGLIEVATPEASLATAVDGRYLIEAADGSRPGRIAVFEGIAEITPAGAAPIRLTAGEALIFAPGAPPERAPAGAASPLMAWAFGTEPRRPVPVAARGMTGIAELSSYGNWAQSADYGDVWYPPVQQDWTPYRDGSWQWREPWGWTWVDAAPWGFAPSHYGRWVQIGPRWGWAPQPVRVVGLRARPAWAPALVAFFGGYAVGQASRPVGWVPLGPREAFYPWYRASPRYVQRVNIRQVTNVVTVRNVWVERGGRDFRWDDDRRRDPGFARFHDRRLDEFRNRRAAIQVDERVMHASLPVRGEARRLRVEDSRRAELLGGLPVRPLAETRGVTERSAERLGLPPGQFRRPDDRDRAAAPPPAVRAALAERRQDAARDPAEPGRDTVRRDAARDDTRRDSAREDARRDSAREDARREPDRATPPRDDDRAERQRAIRERLSQQPRPAPDQARRAPDEQREQAREDRRKQADALRTAPGEARRPQDAVRPPPDPARAPQRDSAEEARRPQRDPATAQPDEARRQQEQQREQARESRRKQADALRTPPGEARTPAPAQPQREPARQQAEEARRQQREQASPQPGQAPRAEDDARRQQAEQARQQQREQQRRQQEEGGRQQADQARQQQQEQARQQQRQQQQDQARQQQEQARQQQRQQQQDQARQQQEQARQQQRQQQQDQARQQQEQARQQQQDQARQQQEQARQQQRQQQQDQARQQQEQARQQQRQQQQDQARQQQEQARQQQRQQQQDQARQQQEQARQQQAEQRRQQR